MAIKRWKKFEQSDGFRRFKLRGRQLIGSEPTFSLDVNLATEHWAGWDLAPEAIKNGALIYSIGICDDIDFELVAIDKKNAEVFAFDPTPYSVDWVAQQSLPSSFNFYPWAAAAEDGQFFLYPRISRKGKKSTTMYTFHNQSADNGLDGDGVKVEALCIPTMASRLKHQQVDVLKMDIEGAEYEVLESLLASQLRPTMLLVEFHHRFKGIGKQKTEQAVARLRAQGYCLASVSITGREMCFILSSTSS